MVGSRRGRTTLAIALLAFALVQRVTGGSAVAFSSTGHTVVPLTVRSASARPNPELEDAVFSWLNRERTNEGVPPLRASTVIRTVARMYGVDLFAHGYLSHVSPDGRTLEDRLATGGLGPRVVGENLAYAGTVEDAERALWHSEQHRRNILYPGYRAVGVAVIDGGDKGLIIVQDFAGDP